MKRSKNIFNSLIAHESLLEEEGNRDFKIGSKSVTSNWLADVPHNEYRKYLMSALHLSVLQKDLDDLREGEQNKKSNIFKIVKTKKKMDTLDLLEIEEEKPLQRSLQKNEPPETQNLIIQKMSAGFFNSLLSRKCRIEQKELYIESMKDQNQKWIPIGIEAYSLELEDKEKPLGKQQFKQFQWIKDFNFRLLLSASEKKGYCMYGNQDNLKKFQRYFQVENIQVKQLNVFKTLDSQLQQKIITLFGNKLRFYDHNIKIRKAEKDAQMISIQAIQKQFKIIQNSIDPEKQGKIKQKSSEGLQSSAQHISDIDQSSFIEQDNKHADKIQVSALSLEGRPSQKLKIKEKEKKSESEPFKLKVKSSTIFYEEIGDGIEFDDKDGYSVNDLKLNLKEDIGMSEVDQESQKSRSVMSHRLQARKRITKMTLENVLDHSEKFNINIYEVSSNVEDDTQNEPQKSEGNSLSPKSKAESSLEQFVVYRQSSDEFKRHNSLKISHISEMKRQSDRKSSEVDAIMDFFQLDKIRPSDEEEEEQNSFDSGKSQMHRENTFPLKNKDNYLIKNFKKKKINEVDIISMNRPEKTYFLISQIKMMMPYHQSSIRFQIIQIDPDLDMQNKIVACAMVEGTMTEKIVDGQRYMLYTCENGIHFKMSQDSHYFIFVLQEESKCHYLHFQMDPCPKYQRNYSQLLKTKLDREGYPFAICLVLYASPQPIILEESLNTIQFMKNYLREGENYDFKLNFIDNKRRLHQVRKQWNKIHIKQALLAGDEEAFAKSVFLGMSDSIFMQLKKKVSYNPRKLFNFTDNERKMIEDNVLTNLLELKSFMKPAALVAAIINAPFNQSLKERLEHVYVYCLNRYQSVRNLALVFVKAILDKLEPILILCRREEEVSAVIDLYAEIEYQIDDLFIEMSRYFKK